MFYVLLCVTLFPFLFCNHLDGEERAGCFALVVFLVSRDCCVTLPHNSMGLSAVCGCGISCSYSLFSRIQRLKQQSLRDSKTQTSVSWSNKNCRLKKRCTT